MSASIPFERLARYKEIKNAILPCCDVQCKIVHFFPFDFAVFLSFLYLGKTIEALRLLRLFAMRPLEGFEPATPFVTSISTSISGPIGQSLPNGSLKVLEQPLTFRLPVLWL